MDLGRQAYSFMRGMVGYSFLHLFTGPLLAALRSHWIPYKAFPPENKIRVAVKWQIFDIFMEGMRPILTLYITLEWTLSPFLIWSWKGSKSVSLCPCVYMCVYTVNLAARALRKIVRILLSSDSDYWHAIPASALHKSGATYRGFLHFKVCRVLYVTSRTSWTVTDVGNYAWDGIRR